MATEATDNDVAFCTFGMFIIDEIEYINGLAPAHSIIGGAGTYAALGARLAAGYRQAHRVSWIVDRGSDFPSEFKDLIDTWGTACRFRTDLTRLTTRAWNGYGQNEHRSFKYLTAKIRLEEHSLTDEQVLARSFHMVCSPTRCIDLASRIKTRREVLDPNRPGPVIVWEPIPDLCTPDELENLREAARYVSVISPNGGELAQFFTSSTSPDWHAMIKSMLSRCHVDARPPVVVRDGADGSRIYHAGSEYHLPAYHQDQAMVVDPTGGGNQFLGALAVAMAGVCSPRTLSAPVAGLSREAASGHLGQLALATVHGTIAASYAIEQVGVPVLKDQSRDLWNSQEYCERFEQYVSKISTLKP